LKLQEAMTPSKDNGEITNKEIEAKHFSINQQFFWVVTWRDWDLAMQTSFVLQ